MMDEEFLVNDENAFKTDAGTKENGTVTDVSSNRHSLDKNPLKPLNDAFRLSGNSKELSGEKTPASSPYSLIRQMDSAERWVERNRVVIKDDHMVNLNYAGNILKDLVGVLPIDEIENRWMARAEEDNPNVVDTNTEPSDLDELSDMLDSLDISPSLSSNVGSHNSSDKLKNTSTKVNPVLQDISTFGSPVEKKGSPERIVVQESDFDDEVQFGKQSAFFSDTTVNDSEAASELTLKMDTENPFETRGKMANSPVRELDMTPIIAAHGNSWNPLSMADGLEINDPFQTKTKVADSPMLDIEDPFQTKTKVADSPKIDVDPFQTKTKVADSPKVDVDPFQTKTKVADSPKVDVDPFQTKTKVADSPMLDIEDPFQTKTKVADSPKIDVNPFQTKTQVADSPKMDIGDPFQPKTKVADSPKVDVDPFQPKTKVADSPKIDVDPFQPKTQVADSPKMDIGDPFQPKTKVADSPKIDVDPFQTKTQVADSPKMDIGDPFQPKTKVADSPKVDVDPFQTKTKVADSPKVDVDPFQTKTKVADSPKVDVDPFQTKTKVADSPKVDVDPFQTKTKVADSPLLDIEDPFQTKTEVADSPMLDIEDPFQTKTKVADSPTLDIEDPFQTKTKVADSPKVDVDPFQTKTKVADSPKVDVDPFQTKTKVADSPLLDIEDPFQTKTKVADSPTLDIEDPFQTKTKVADSPKVDVDPFQTKTKVADSPMLDIEDPFQTKTKVADSPTLDIEDPFQTKTKVADSPKVDVDPFQTKTKVADSPMLDIEDPFQTKTKVADSPMLDVEDPFQTQTKIFNSTLKELDEDEVSFKSNAHSVVEDMDEGLVASKGDSSHTELGIVDSLETIENVSKLDENMISSKEDELIEENSPKLIEIENLPVMLTEDISEREGNITSSNPTISNADLETESSIQIIDDPFKTSQQIVNSPVKESHQDLLRSASEYSAEDIHIENPFTMSCKVANSPVQVLGKNKFDPIATISDMKTDLIDESLNTLCDPVQMGGVSQMETLRSKTNDKIDDDDDDEIVFKSTDQFKNTPVKNLDELLCDVKSPLVDSLEFPSELSVPFQTIYNSPDNKIPSETKTVREDISVMELEGALLEQTSPPVEETSENKLNLISTVKDPDINSSVKGSETESLCELNGNVTITGKGRDDVNQSQVLGTFPLMTGVGINQEATRQSLNIQQVNDGLNVCSDEEEKTEQQMPISPMNESDDAHRPKDGGFCQDNANKMPGIEHALTVDTSEGPTEQCDDPSDHDLFVDAVEDPEENIQIKRSDLKEPNENAAADGEDILNKSSEFDEVLFVDASEDTESDKQLSSSGPAVEEESDNGVECEKIVDGPDEFDDMDFVDGVEAFDCDPSTLQDKLEKDLNLSKNWMNRGSVLLKFDPLSERESHIMNVDSPKHKPTRVSEIFKGSTLPSDDGVCLFGTPPKKASRRPGISRPSKISVVSIEEETPAHQVDMMLNLEAHECMSQAAENNFSSSSTNLVDLGAVYTEADFKKLKMDLTLHYEELMLKKDQQFEKRLLEKDEDYAKKLAELEDEKKILTEEKTTLAAKSNVFKTKLLLTRPLFDDYGQLISKLTDENKALQSTIGFVKQDHTQVKEDYKKLDKSFDDLFHRYEKMKKTLEQCAENEAALKKSLEESIEKFKEKAAAMKKMKEQAEAKLTEQEEQIEKLNSSQKSEAARLEAVLKRKEMEVQSLKNALEQKKAENKELTELCDSLINKVSGK